MADDPAPRRVGANITTDHWGCFKKETPLRVNTAAANESMEVAGSVPNSASSGSSNSNVSQISAPYNSGARKLTPIFEDFRDARVNILRKRSDDNTQTRQPSASQQVSAIPCALTSMTNNAHRGNENVAPPSVFLQRPEPAYLSSPIELASSSTPEQVRQLRSSDTFSPADRNSGQDAEQWPATNPYNAFSPHASMSPIYTGAAEHIERSRFAGNTPLGMDGYQQTDQDVLGSPCRETEPADTYSSPLHSYYTRQRLSNGEYDYGSTQELAQAYDAGVGVSGSAEEDLIFSPLSGEPVRMQQNNPYQLTSSPFVNNPLNNAIEQLGSAESNSGSDHGEVYSWCGSLNAYNDNREMTAPEHVATTTMAPGGAPLVMSPSSQSLEDESYENALRIPTGNGFNSPHNRLFLPNYDSSETSNIVPWNSQELEKYYYEQSQLGSALSAPAGLATQPHSEAPLDDSQVLRVKSYNELFNHSSSFFDPTQPARQLGERRIGAISSQNGLDNDESQYSQGDGDLGAYRYSQESIAEPVVVVSPPKVKNFRGLEIKIMPSVRRKKVSPPSAESSLCVPGPAPTTKDAVRLSAIAKDGIMPGNMLSGRFVPLEDGAITDLRTRDAAGEKRYRQGTFIDKTPEKISQSDLQHQASGASKRTMSSNGNASDWQTVDEDSNGYQEFVRKINRDGSAGSYNYNAPLGQLGKITTDSIADVSTEEESFSQSQDISESTIGPNINAYSANGRVLVHPAQAGNGHDRFPRQLPGRNGQVMLPSAYGQGQGGMPRDAHRVAPRVIPRSFSNYFSPARHRNQEYIELDDMAEADSSPRRARRSSQRRGMPDADSSSSSRSRSRRRFSFQRRGMPERQKSQLSIVTNVEEFHSSGIETPNSPAIMRRAVHPANNALPDLWMAAGEGIPNRRYRAPVAESVYSSSNMGSSPGQSLHNDRRPLYSQRNEQFVHKPRADVRLSTAKEGDSRLSISSQRSQLSLGVRRSMLFAGPHRKSRDFTERRLPKKQMKTRQRKLHGERIVGGNLPPANTKVSRRDSTNVRGYRASPTAGVASKRYGELNVRPTSMLLQARQASAMKAKERTPGKVVQIVPGQLQALRKEFAPDVRHYSGFSDSRVFVTHPRSQEVFEYRDPCAPLLDLNWKKLYGRRTWNAITESWKTRATGFSAQHMSRMDGAGRVNSADSWRVEPAAPVLAQGCPERAISEGDEDVNQSTLIFNFVVVVISCVVPPLAPLLAWGGLDGLMSWWTKGERLQFNRTPKVIGMTATFIWIVLAIIVGVIIAIFKAVKMI